MSETPARRRKRQNIIKATAKLFALLPNTKKETTRKVLAKLFVLHETQLMLITLVLDIITILAFINSKLDCLSNIEESEISIV